MGANAVEIPATDNLANKQRTDLRLLVTEPQQARLVGPDNETLDLPAEIYNVIRFVADQVLAGRGVTVIPRDHDLTTTEAAEMLNVSRPFLIKQLQAGALEFHYVGSHRRVTLNDLLLYQQKLAERSRNALERMTQQAEELGLYEE